MSLDSDTRTRPAAAKRAALLLVLTVGISAAVAGTAMGAPDPSSLVLGPVEAIPPPAPKLPGKGHHGAAGNEGHKPKRDHQREQGTGSAEALILTGSCAPFTHTQSYPDWGPAVAYGGPVTVMYQADRCSTPNGSALDLAAEGTAQIFQGDAAAGALLDTKPFRVTGTWREPQNMEAWPPAWWGCGVPYASYTWEIPGVYSFEVSAEDGFWTLNVSSEGVGSQAVSWTHDGCA